MAQGDERVTETARDLAGRAFVRRVQVGVQEGNGDGGEVFSKSHLKRFGKRHAIQRADFRAVGGEPFAGFDQPAIQRLGPHDVQGEEVGPRLVADHQRVSEPLGGDEQSLRARALQKRIGGDGRPHLDRLDAGRRKGVAGPSAQDSSHRLHGGVGIGG